jgi:hypothetical protein
VWLQLPCGVGQLYPGGPCAVLSGQIQPCTPVCGCMAFQVAGEGAGEGAVKLLCMGLHPFCLGPSALHVL